LEQKTSGRHLTSLRPFIFALSIGGNPSFSTQFTHMRSIILLFVSFVLIVPSYAQSLSPNFFDQVDRVLKKSVDKGVVEYNEIADNALFRQLIADIATVDLSGADDATQQAFYINAYNLLVIEQALANFPISSVMDVPNFFDQKKIQVAGKKMSLNQLEKETLFKLYPDPRYHFVLVCGALGCPPLTDFAYRPASLDAQLERQTQLALNDPYFIRVDEASQKIELSQIFNWYRADFGANQNEVLAYINRYRSQPIPEDFRVGYYTYDWTLNDRARPVIQASQDGDAPAAANAIRYVVSSTIPKGTFENKIFNNLYTQVTRNDAGDLSQRSTFFTTFITSLYGVSDRFNAGVEVRYRRVSNAGFPSPITGVFQGGDASTHREGISTIGPKIRWAPIPKWGNFSVQSALWFPVGNDLEGTANLPFFDWNGPTFWTQVFNDFTLGNRFSLFTEIDVLWEDIGNSENGAFNRVSTPVTVIGSFFPNPKTTLYALSGYSPYWTPNFDYFAQAGVGAKYQFTPKFELEALYTLFTNGFLQENNGRASTLNLGVRFNL